MEALLPADVTMRLCVVRGGPTEPSSVGYVCSARWDTTHGSRLFILYSSGVLRGWDVLTGQKTDYALYIPCRGVPTAASQLWGPEVLDDRRAAAQMTHFEVLPAVDTDASVSAAPAVRGSGVRLMFVVARSSTVYMVDLPAAPSTAPSAAGAAKAALLQGSHFLSGSRVYQLSGGALPGTVTASATWECTPGPRGLSFVVVGSDDGSLVGWAVGNDVGASSLVAAGARRTAEPALARTVGRIEAEFNAVLNNNGSSNSSSARSLSSGAAAAGAVAGHEGGVAYITPLPGYLTAALGAGDEAGSEAAFTVGAGHVHPRLPARSPVPANTLFATAGKADGRVRLWRAAVQPPSSYPSLDAPARLAPYTVALQPVGELPTDGSCVSALGGAAWPLPHPAGAPVPALRSLLAAGSKDGVVSVYEVVAPTGLCSWPSVALASVATTAVSCRLVATAASRPLDPVLGVSLVRPPAPGADLRLAVGACDGSLSLYTLAGTGSSGAAAAGAPLTLLLSGFHSSRPGRAAAARAAPSPSGLLTVGSPYDGIKPTRAYQVLMSLGPQAAAQLADDVARGVTTLAGAYARAGSAASPVVGPGGASGEAADSPRTLPGEALGANIAPSAVTPAALVSAALSSAVLDELQHALVVVGVNDAARVTTKAAGALVAVTGGGDVLLWPAHALPTLAPPASAAAVAAPSVPSPPPASVTAAGAQALATAVSQQQQQQEQQEEVKQGAEPEPASRCVAPEPAAPAPAPAVAFAPVAEAAPAGADAAVSAPQATTEEQQQQGMEQQELDEELQPRAIPAAIMRVLSGTASSNAKTSSSSGTPGGSRSSTPGRRGGSKGRARSRRGSAAATAAVAAALASSASAVAAGLYADTAPLCLPVAPEAAGASSCCGGARTETPARRVASATAARVTAAVGPVAGAAAVAPAPGAVFRNPARVAALVGSEAARATAAAIAVARSLGPEGAAAGHAFDHPTVAGVAERALPDAAPSHHLVAPSLGSSSTILAEIQRLEAAQFDEIAALRRILKARGVTDPRVGKALKERSDARRGVAAPAAAAAPPAQPAGPEAEAEEELAYVPAASAGGSAKAARGVAARKAAVSPAAATGARRRAAPDPVAATGPHVTGADVVSWHFSLRGSGSSSAPVHKASKKPASAEVPVRVTRHAAPAADASTISFVNASTYIQTN